MKWREIPPNARRYVLYHVFVTPGLICWYLLPLYLMMTGLSVFEVGWLFTIINLLSIPLTYLVCKRFDRVPVKRGLITIDMLDGVAYTFYFLAKGAFAPFALLIGRMLEEISFLFYPLYPAYERIIYPRERRSEILSWHLRLPEVSSMVSFPLIGYLLGYIFTKPYHYRSAFLLFGLLTVFTVWYLWKFLPEAGEKERLSFEKFSFKFDRKFALFITVDSLITLAGSITPELVLINYVVFTLKKTIFEVTLIEAGMAAVTIFVTFLTERAKNEWAGIYMISGLGSLVLYSLIMGSSPSFVMTLFAYVIMRFGSSLMFPFYRDWMWSFIPSERSAQLHGALSSLRRSIKIISPFLAGWQAFVHPVLPYITGAFLYSIAAALILVWNIRIKGFGNRSF